MLKELMFKELPTDEELSYLFTNAEIRIIKNIFNNIPLTKTERETFYRRIKKKLRDLEKQIEALRHLRKLKILLRLKFFS